MADFILIFQIKVCLNRTIDTEDFFSDKTSINSLRIFVSSFLDIYLYCDIALASRISIFKPFVKVIFWNIISKYIGFIIKKEI